MKPNKKWPLLQPMRDIEFIPGYHVVVKRCSEYTINKKTGLLKHVDTNADIYAKYISNHESVIYRDDNIICTVYRYTSDFSNPVAIFIYHNSNTNIPKLPECLRTQTDVHRLTVLMDF